MCKSTNMFPRSLVRESFNVNNYSVWEVEVGDLYFPWFSHMEAILSHSSDGGIVYCSTCPYTRARRGREGWVLNNTIIVPFVYPIVHWDCRYMQLQLASITITNSEELFHQYLGLLLQPHCVTYLYLLLLLVAETQRSNDSHKTYVGTLPVSKGNLCRMIHRG